LKLTASESIAPSMIDTAPVEIDESGFVDCGYCDKRFVLRGGPADT